MRLSAGLLCIVTQAWTVNANVEKTIFLGPNPVTLSNVRPGLDYLALHYLSPDLTILPIRVPVQFPTESVPRGLESWYLLRRLQDGRRYEVRICWPATQPTDFWLDTYSVTHVFDTPDLISSLSQYTTGLRRDQVDDERDKQAPPAAPESVLFLRLQAAASYYSTNRTLMDYPPPVDADIILDPFILNIFPQSLGPIAIYITTIAIGAWFLSGYIYGWLLSAAAGSRSKPHTD